MSPNVIEVNASTFEQEVIARSHEVPVVVDFWAAWCAPCRALGPVLERLAEEDGGRWILAKLDVDANPSISAAAGIMGIPAVKAFVDGKVIDEFTGAIPEPQVRSWLRGFVPDRAAEVAELGLKAERAGDIAQAKKLFEEALSHNADEPTAKAGLARIALIQEAESMDESSLVELIEASPNDVTAAAGLAKLRLVRGEPNFHEPLVQQIRRFGPGGDDGPRKRLIDLLDTLPPDDPRSAEARRALANALF